MNVKTGAAVVCMLLAVGAASAWAPASVSKQGRRVNPVARGVVKPLPEAAVVNDLDRAVQLRFLKTPFFGRARITLGPPPNPHFQTERFVTQTNEEFRVVKELQETGWKVGIYLMGRRAYERPKAKGAAGEKQLYVEYRLSRPVPVTEDTKQKELADEKRLRDEVAAALYRFNKTDSHTFAAGKWTYVARPLRANQSCLHCHTDLFVTKKTGKNTYTYRPRLVGDPIGVLVYAFKRPD